MCVCIDMHMRTVLKRYLFILQAQILKKEEMLKCLCKLNSVLLLLIFVTIVWSQNIFLIISLPSSHRRGNFQAELFYLCDEQLLRVLSDAFSVCPLPFSLHHV